MRWFGWLLMVAGCAPEVVVDELATVDRDPAPAEATAPLTMDPVVRGEAWTVRLSGVPAGSGVDLVWGQDVGNGPCWDALEGRCLDVTGDVLRLASGTASIQGEVSFSLVVPMDVGLGPRALQVVVSNRDGVELWEPVSVYVQPADCERGTVEGGFEGGVAGPWVLCGSREARLAVQVPAGGGVTLDLEHDPEEGALDLEVWSADDGALLAHRWVEEDDGEALAWLNRGDEAVEIEVRAVVARDRDDEPGVSVAVTLDRYAGEACPEGRLEGLEAPLVAEGLGLCAEGAVDWLPVPVVAGERVQVQATYAVAEGDVDLYLHTAAGEDPTSGSVAHAWSRTDDELLEYVAEADGTLWLAVVLDRDDGERFLEGTSYDLSVEVAPGL